ncbi:hypothetical protein AVEN_264706-1 [Araneus ventricosus]|uniref:Uncharacterized protein n=1 Tax=Araneus ventricosus TaxID=182803 RepID=A0A4Y2TLN8_ARAVE|nr:hypothetical protein AVEN_151759-1 [Araneus ventricosus]GBO01565.1 hypothetical protein AVEN_264706-1 [Araneus ventricosus]
MWSEDMLDALNKLYVFLDNDDCQYLLSDVVEMLLHFSTRSDKLYSEKGLRELLSENYGNTFLISAGMKCFGTVVSFRPVVSQILTDNCYADQNQREWPPLNFLVYFSNICHFPSPCIDKKFEPTITQNAMTIRRFFIVDYSDSKIWR